MEFRGAFKCTPPAEPSHTAYLRKFLAMKHLHRNLSQVMLVPDPLRTAAGLPLGLDGEFFVGDDLRVGLPAGTKPSADCPWEPVIDEANRLVGLACRKTLIDDADNVQLRLEWIKYLLGNLFIPWGYVLDGVVRWHDFHDHLGGAIVLKSNIPYMGNDLVIRFEETL